MVSRAVRVSQAKHKQLLCKFCVNDIPDGAEQVQKTPPDKTHSNSTFTPRLAQAEGDNLIDSISGSSNPIFLDPSAGRAADSEP